MTIKINQKFTDTAEGRTWTVTDIELFEEITGIENLSITLTDEDGIPTIYPDHFDDGDFEDWFESNEQ